MTPLPSVWVYRSLTEEFDLLVIPCLVAIIEEAIPHGMIALLYLLHSVPALPSSNTINHRQEDDYTLPLAREQRLASILAFLANTRVDTNHIPALCLKENSQSIDVLVAVNKTTWEDGRSNLLELQRHFEQLFAILSAVSAESLRSHGHEDRIFDAIIDMCSARILCRLRFTAKGTQPLKQSLKLICEEAIRGIQKLTITQLGGHRDVCEGFVTRSKEVVKLADQWLRHQTNSQLKQLIDGVYRLNEMGNLQPLLDLVPNRFMCPSSRQSLVNIVSKVSRYREAARYLYRTAKKYKPVQSMRIIPVNLAQDAFKRTTYGTAKNPSPCLNTTIKRITGDGRKPELKHLCHLLNITDQQLNEQFANQARKTLKEAKIHAEVQLIYYCDANTSLRPPRVICSSKDACFLCNVFISTHGNMYTPRQHGRLYPGWRLPNSPLSSHLEQRFAAVLESQIKSSLGMLLTRRSKTSCGGGCGIAAGGFSAALLARDADFHRWRRRFRIPGSDRFPGDWTEQSRVCADDI
ncbi:hypothetical protein LEMA_P017610.1 [Plenodomus lingam JN3]|uniref:Uncharacterized protein n=1 Tax=Leptosphaeria maculans (strain JN3 / isolate v23.1.3 / race Av1-4-5-6-7-8) TaxID=985895 RepID=E5AAE0_LEPMJ|nr:hypothetical protein LEMA_P017610.1 [Plenodomus lingam JN3]CBY00631.1 hypothetical protein LEMA_P017610.1 [Plenodomus lingam JN3]